MPRLSEATNNERIMLHTPKEDLMKAEAIGRKRGCSRASVLRDAMRRGLREILKTEPEAQQALAEAGQQG